MWNKIISLTRKWFNLSSLFVVYCCCFFRCFLFNVSNSSLARSNPKCVVDYELVTNKLPPKVEFEFKTGDKLQLPAKGMVKELKQSKQQIKHYRTSSDSSILCSNSWNLFTVICFVFSTAVTFACSLFSFANVLLFCYVLSICVCVFFCCQSVDAIMYEMSLFAAHLENTKALGEEEDMVDEEEEEKMGGKK